MSDQDRKEISTSDRFRRMADQIDHNAASGAFAGACVIVPPQGAGSPMEIIVLDPDAGAVQFWSLVVAKVNVQLEEMKKAEMRAPVYGR